MSSLKKSSNANRDWRSLRELNDWPAFRALAESEFPAAVDCGEISRRRWLQLMGASLALAGVGGCRWEREEILPLAERPPNRVPGKRQRYATAMDLSGSAIGLLVTAVDGRPIKIEGNPRHPQSLGATTALAQASILELYDPDRSRSVREMTPQGEIVHTDWQKFDAFARSHFGKLRDRGGAGLRVLSEASSSPTLRAMRDRLLEAFPEARWHEYEPISRDNERAGAAMASGRALRPHYGLDKARVIVALDADLLGSHPAALEHARDFILGRDPDSPEMSRLYVVESCFSITGAAADHRLPLAPSAIARFAAFLEDYLKDRSDERPEGVTQFDEYALALAEDLDAHRGQSIVAVGPRQPAEVHRTAHRINAVLGNVGKTVTYTADPDPERPSHVEAIRSLVADMDAGKVETLLVLGGNPVYSAPADLDFAAAFSKVPTRIHLSLYRNETSRLATWHAPQAHFLESWSDGRSWDGTYSMVQPLIEPLWGGRSSIELLASILGNQPVRAYDLVRETFRGIVGEEDFESRWRVTLHDGLLAESAWPAESPAADQGPIERPEVADIPEGRLEIVFCQDASVGDGRFANNGWLQEMPDPMTKLTWDNAAVISPATAEELGVESGSLVRMRSRDRELEIPAYVLPGQAAGTVALALGYGRTAAGHVGGDAEEGIEPVGVDVYPLRTSGAMEFDSGLTVEPTGRMHRLAVTQEHHAINTIGFRGQAERLGELAREASREHFRQHPEFTKHAVHHPPLESLWEEPSFQGPRWGMAIDLSKCIGCNACVVACQAENNVPIVGKQRVLEGREMHWIRIDRYFRGEDLENPPVSFQPVMCHHCENAPCEQVCPVAATVHSEEGLNDMVYNRCVGTRYCANNCPYKVRRFNYFSYHQDLGEPANEVTKMVYNPEVTIRTRGVMEKCTYCVQRIQAVKIEAKNQRRAIADGEIQTACQQACPTRAIEFGDLSDPASRVRRAHEAARAYGMLAELNVKPRTTYLARIRNPHPDLDDTEHEHDRPTG